MQDIMKHEDKSHRASTAMAFLHGAADGEGPAGGSAPDGETSGPSPHTLTQSASGSFVAMVCDNVVRMVGGAGKPIICTSIKRDVQESSRNYIYAIYGLVL